MRDFRKGIAHPTQDSSSKSKNWQLESWEVPEGPSREGSSSRAASGLQAAHPPTFLNDTEGTLSSCLEPASPHLPLQGFPESCGDPNRYSVMCYTSQDLGCQPGFFSVHAGQEGKMWPQSSRPHFSPGWSISALLIQTIGLPRPSIH